MSHYDNACNSAVALKALVFKVPAAGVGGVLMVGCFLLYPAIVSGDQQGAPSVTCLYGGKPMEITVDRGEVSALEWKCVIYEFDDDERQRLQALYPDYVVRKTAAASS